MPSPVIEGLRQQFFASLGISENTPIADSDAANLIDQWEQYLYLRASGGGSMVVQTPGSAAGRGSIVLAPPVNQSGGGSFPVGSSGGGSFPVGTRISPPNQGGATRYTPPPAARK